MKALITGGNGFIGSNLIKRLLSEGHEVVSIDDLSTGLKEYEVNGCTYVYGYIENLMFWKGDTFDICYHLAALSRIQPSFDDPADTFRVNAGGCSVVAEWAPQDCPAHLPPPQNCWGSEQHFCLLLRCLFRSRDLCNLQ